MRSFLILTIFSLCFFDCSLIAKKGYGGKAAKIENQQSIEAWLKNEHLEKLNVTTISPESFSFFFPQFNQAPLLFDSKTGRFCPVGFTNGKYCPNNVDSYIKTVLPFDKLWNKPDSFIVTEYIILSSGTSMNRKNNYEKKRDTTIINLHELLKNFRTLDGKPYAIDKIDSDYILILPFAIYFGHRLQVKDLKKYYNAAQENKYSKIKIIFLNLDKQEWWGKDWNEQIRISI